MLPSPDADDGDDGDDPMPSYEATVVLRAGHGSRIIMGNLDRKCRDSVELAISWLAFHYQKLNHYIMGSPRERFMSINQDIVVQAWDVFNALEGCSGGVSIGLATVAATMGCRLDRSFGATGAVVLNGNVMIVGDIEAKAVAARDLGLAKLIVPTGSYLSLEVEGIAEEGLRDFCRDSLRPVGDMVDVLSHMIPGKMSQWMDRWSERVIVLWKALQQGKEDTTDPLFLSFTPFPQVSMPINRP